MNSNCIQARNVSLKETVALEIGNSGLNEQNEEFFYHDLNCATIKIMKKIEKIIYQVCLQW